MDKLESHVLLELNSTACEGASKMGEFIAFSQKLVMQVMLQMHVPCFRLHQRHIWSSRQCLSNIQ